MRLQAQAQRHPVHFPICHEVVRLNRLQVPVQYGTERRLLTYLRRHFHLAALQRLVQLELLRLLWVVPEVLEARAVELLALPRLYL